MKKRVVVLMNFIIVLFFVTILFGCEDNFDKEANNVKPGIISKKINLDDFFEKDKIAREIEYSKQKINELESKSSRIIVDTINGFKINTDEVLFLSYGSLYTLTFPIYRETSSDKLENLVISKLTDGTYSKKILTYDLTEQEKIDLANNNLKTIANPIETTSLNSDQSCVIVTQTVIIACSSGEHDASNIEAWGNCQADEHPRLITISFKICTSISDGSPDTGGVSVWDGFGESPSGQITLPANYPTPTTNPEEYENGISQPVEPSNDIYDSPPNDETPCEKLKNLAAPSKGNLKLDVDWLKTKVTEKKEFGVEVEMRRINGEFMHPTNRVEDGQHYYVVLNVGDYRIGSCHNHPLNSVPIPSFGDLDWIKTCRDSVITGREEEVFSMVVCKTNDGTINVYAIKISNFENLVNELNLVWNKPKYASIMDEKLRLETILDDEKNFYKYGPNSNQVDVEKKFLQRYGGFGIDLYKATNESLNQWNKLELGNDPNSANPSELIVIETPC
ncbi:MAG: hypothetical protein JNJ52_02515 [Flavobacterium sp.]|nr:hypothetical protein [Flavobacterium sp.]